MRHLPVGLRSILPPLLLVLLSGFVQFSVVLGTEVYKPLRNDALKYVAYAYNLKHLGTYSNQVTWLEPDVEANADKDRPPGYPAFLSLFVEGPPDRSFEDRITRAQALLGMATTLLAYLIALQLLPRAWSFAAGLLVATSPHLATMSTYLLTEPLATTMVQGSVLAMILAARAEAARWQFALAGVLLGMCSLVRPQLLYLPLVALLLALALRSWRPYLRGILLASVCFAAVLAPWMVRNATVPPSQANLMINTLYHGSFRNLTYRDNPRSYGAPYRFDPDRAQITRDLPSVMEHIGKTFAEEPVKQTIWYLVGKPGFFLSWDSVEGAADILIYPVLSSPYSDNRLFAASRHVGRLIHWPLMLLALAAMFFALLKPHWLARNPSQRIAAVVVAGVFAYAVALHMVVAPFPRYAIPFRPLIYILALAMLHALWLRLRQGRHGLQGATEATRRQEPGAEKPRHLGIPPQPGNSGLVP